MITRSQLCSSKRIDKVTNRSSECLVLDKLLVNLRVVLEQAEHDSGECLVVLDSGGGWCVFQSVLVGGICGDLWRDVLLDAAEDAVAVVEQSPELIVEGLENVAETVEFGLGLSPAASS